MAKANWLTISPMSGIGNATIRNIGSEHTGRLDRTTTVTGKAVGIASEKTYSVVQRAKSEFVAVNDASYQVAATGETVTVSGTSNSPLLTVTVDKGGTVGALTVNGSKATNGQNISGDPGADAQYTWKVQIQIAENPTANQRSLTVKVQGSSSSIAGTIEVVQAASSFTYEYVPSASVPTIAASGGNSVVSAQLKTYRNGSLVSTKTVTPTLKGSATGFSISGATVTAANRGTTVGNVRSIVVTCNYVTSETGETLSDTVTISQAANSRVIVYGKPTITSFEVADIPASGGSVSSGDVEYSQSRHYYYDSGQTEELSPLTTGGKVTFGDAVSAGSLGTTVKSRTIVGQLTCQVSMNGQTSVEGDASVYQQANTATYGNVTITGGTVSDIPAKGGSVSSMSGISASQTVSFTSKATRAGKVSISYSTAVSGTSLGTTIKNRTKLGTLTATATGEGSKSATKALDVYQAKNVPVSIYSNASFSYPTGAIPAAGGTKSPLLTGAVGITWSSGSEQSTSASGSYTGFSLTSSRTYSMVAATGFSINTLTGVITATNRGTTEGAARSCGNVSSTLDWTLTITSTYGGGTLEASDTDTLTTPVSQAANTLSYSYANPTVTVAAVSDIPASGGTKSSSTVTYKQVRTNSYSSGSSTTTELTSGGTVSWSDAISGSNLGTTAKARTKLGTLTATVTMNGKSGTGSVDVYQQANAITKTTYSTPTVTISSVADIPAKGGSVSTGTATYSQTKTDTYTSGSSKPTTLTSGGTVKWTTVSAGTKGTTVSARTEVDEITCTVTLNSKSGSATKMVYQAANTQTQTGIRIVGDTEGGLGWVPYANWDSIKANGKASDSTTEDNNNGWAIKFSGYKQYSYTSGATKEVYVYSIPSNVCYTDVDYIGKHDKFGFTLAPSYRGTTVGAARTGHVWWEENGFVSNKLAFTQEANAATTITYGTPVVSLTVADIPASGGSVSSGTVTYSQSRTQNYTSGATSPLSALTTGGIVSYSTAVSGSGLGTTIKNRTKIGTLTATVTMNGKSGSKSADVYQAGNYVKSVDLTGFAIAYSKSVSAAGGTVSPSVTQGSVKFTFTSGASSSTTPSSTYGSLTSSVTYSGSAANGFSAPNSSSGAMTASDRGTTEGASRNSGTVTATKKVTWTHASSYSGGGTKTDSMTDTDYATQQANVKTPTTISYGVWQVSVSANRYTTSSSPCPAGGGTCTITRSASRTRTQNYSYTSGATSSTALSNETATPTLSISGTGASLSGTTVTWADRGTTTGNARQATVTATYGGVEAKEIVYQQENTRTTGSIIYGDWQVSVSANRYTTTSSPCPAGGGTCTISASASRTRVQNYSYTSGSTSTETLSNQTGSPTLSISGTGASLSGTTVTWASRGTTTGEVRQATVTATIDSVNAKEIVYQQANSYEDVYLSPIINTPNPSHNFSKDGGTWASGVTVSQTGTRTYTSGSTSPLTGSASFTLSESASWLTTSGGSITASANTGASSRSATVTINATGSGGATSRSTLSITQDARAYLNVSPTSLTFTAAGGTKSITIDTNESWTIS